MLAVPEFIVAQPIPALIPVQDARAPLRVLIASLVHGGAERIVMEWLDAEARRNRSIELAVLYSRASGWRAPRGVHRIERNGETPEAFLRSLAVRWSGCAVSTHLIDDAFLRILWEGGVATIPTVHNAREGWRNEPAGWEPRHVPFAIACAEAVREQMVRSGCTVPVTAIRHVPAAPRGAADPAARRAIRDAWRIGEDTFLVGAVGAFKPQKDFPRAVEIVARLRMRRDAALAILGGVLDGTHLAELDRTMDRVVARDMQGHVKLPGFVDPIGPWYCACDALLSTSRYEGFSMAMREALAAGLPVVGLDVGGQCENVHDRLTLLAPDATSDAIAARLATLPVREAIEVSPEPRAPRVWSVASAWRAHDEAALDTLFVTANLNAGGAQRSLVNLASTIAHRHRLAVAVCGETTQGAFADALAEKGIRRFRPAPSPDPFAVSESLLVEAGRTGARTLCFWNADPRVKLLVAKFASPRLRLVDASPGAYAFEEMERERAFASTITFGVDDYYERLDALVLKYVTPSHPPCREVRVIANGVPLRSACSKAPRAPRFLVSGRIAPSKRLETIVAAFASFGAMRPDAELHVVGQAEPRHARYGAQIVAAANGSRVRFRGAQPGLEHLDEEFTAAIVLGTHQGSPNAVLEAMAAGIPVIANASGGTGELVRKGETGWLLDEEADAEALAGAMDDCVARPEVARAFAAAAREQVRRDHSMDEMARRYLECLAPQAY